MLLSMVLRQVGLESTASHCSRQQAAQEAPCTLVNPNNKVPMLAALTYSDYNPAVAMDQMRKDSEVMPLLKVGATHLQNTSAQTQSIEGVKCSLERSTGFRLRLCRLLTAGCISRYCSSECLLTFCIYRNTGTCMCGQNA